MNDIKQLLKQHTELAETASIQANEMINKLPDGMHKALFRSAMTDVQAGNVDMNNLPDFINNLKNKVYANSDNNS